MAEVTPPNLPQELFDLIIDHLHNDKLALRACSLVCTAFLPSCRIHTFASVRLFHIPPTDEDDFELMRKLRNLAAAVQQNPQLGSYIRHLELDGCADQLALPLDRATEKEEKRNEEALQQIFSSLQNLKELTLSRLDDWTLRFSPPFRHALYDLARRSKITHLYLESIYPIPLAFLACFQRLRLLKVDHCTLETGERNVIGGSSCENISKLRVESFHYAGDSEVADDFLRVILKEDPSGSFLHDLRHIDWDSESSSNHIIRHVLMLCSKSLETFKYSVWTYFNPDEIAEAYDLSSMIVLKRLNISVKLFQGFESEHLKFFTWVAKTIRKINASASIKEIIVEVSHTLNKQTPNIAPVQLYGLNILDSAFASCISRGLRLKRMELDVKFSCREKRRKHYSSPEMVGRCKNIFSDQLPTLWKDGILRYELPTKNNTWHTRYTLSSIREIV